MISAIEDFMKHGASAGIVLLVFSALALVIANSPLLGGYEALLNQPIAIVLGPLAIEKNLLLFINDGLMVIFFFLVGLEIKREIVEGELSTREQAILPGIAAAGGMAIPAIIYASLNWESPETLRGWAIPAATDIAFALTILRLAGPRVPLALRIFLTAVAVIDDLGAILVIALFYTAKLELVPLLVAAVTFGGMIVMNRMGVKRVDAYILMGVVLWVAILKSGVHATVAGVLTAMAIPTGPGEEEGPLEELEHKLHAWVSFGVLPIFGFANAGVSFANMSIASFLEPVTLGIIMGLFVGKQIGIFGSCYVVVKLGFARLPEGTTWPQIYAVSLLCGIGFTMSLFIGALAFPDASMAGPVRLGVLGGSIASALVGYLLIKASVAGVPEPAAAVVRSDTLSRDG
ncbi:MAG: Na+/H+ antiporter NhaA [Alphaproteobacteria bacterium]|nr:Na+/H+ antiporter NhaA [Alphaproteobacteria bacterium]